MVGRENAPPEEADMLSWKQQKTVPACMGTHFCNNRHYLQQEARALWHEGEGNHRGDARECTDDDKHTPAVELVG